jgi:hypothetical protein
MLHPLAPRQRPGPREPRLPPKCCAPQHGAPQHGAPQPSARKYSWAGAVTPTQRNITQASAATERLDNGMFQGTPLAGKGNPTWPFSNVPETLTPWRNDLLQRPAIGLDHRAGELRLAIPPLGLARAIVTEVSAWLADIPRRIGDRLFLVSDEEAYWHGWRVTRLHGGLGRSYRDHRFADR